MIDEDEVFDQQEEIIDEVVNEEEILPLVNDEEQGEQESVDDEVTQRAKKFGHLSKEEWIAQGRDPAQYKTPEEFDKTFGELLNETYNTQALEWLIEFRKASPRLFRYYYGQQVKR